MINKVKKIIQLLEIIKHPKGGIKYIFSKGISISSFNLNSILSNYIHELKTIIDVGANIGQYALASSIFYPISNIYCFEPLPEAYQKLRNNTKHYKNIKIYNIALGDRKGSLNFYQNEHSHSSSALKISEEQIKNFPETRNIKTINVTVERLDEFSNSIIIERPVLLKLDVQGYEKKVLDGAKDFLKNIDYLLFETSFVEMYNEEPLFDEMHTIVKNYGFKLLAPVGFLKGNGSQIMQMDVLYEKK
ncbi:MAG: FkbM family methyltransferase [Calditrichaceae bacterium]|nr:FkbM family methyltransferase [Calditrichaceae bacterium]MBN2708168.1 FkbM family methyltransferase [Calditrichaceae bacterium]RQV97166.1 MAG: FkbM family methyltransferase [Calditrichota bacterium]